MHFTYIDKYSDIFNLYMDPQKKVNILYFTENICEIQKG